MSDLPCFVLPRRNATRQHLRDLGNVLVAWSDEELRKGSSLAFIDHIALLDLIGGGDPEGPVGEFLGWPAPEATGEESPSSVATQVVTRTPEELAIFFALRRTPAASLRATLARLRAAVPLDLIEDIRIDRRSWTQWLS